MSADDSLEVVLFISSKLSGDASTHMSILSIIGCESFSYNSKISTDKLEKYCSLGSREKRYMENMFDKLGLTARTYHKILKVARTIADLDGCENIKTKHLNEAICYRSINEKFWGGAVS